MAELKELQTLIESAIKKVSGTKENDVCKFLPVEGGGYMHHFTLRKMKTEEPKKLKKMIDQYIMNSSKPRRVPHKPRRPRGSRKRHDMIALTRGELERVLTHLRTAGDQEMTAKLSPRRSLVQLKRELIRSIRNNDANQELWTSYREAILAQQGTSLDGAPAAKQILVMQS